MLDKLMKIKSKLKSKGLHTEADMFVKALEIGDRLKQIQDKNKPKGYDNFNSGVQDIVKMIKEMSKLSGKTPSSEEIKKAQADVASKDNNALLGLIKPRKGLSEAFEKLYTTEDRDDKKFAALLHLAGAMITVVDQKSKSEAIDKNKILVAKKYSEKQAIIYQFAHLANALAKKGLVDEVSVVTSAWANLR